MHAVKKERKRRQRMKERNAQKAWKQMQRHGQERIQQRENERKSAPKRKYTIVVFASVNEAGRRIKEGQCAVAGGIKGVEASVQLGWARWKGGDGGKGNGSAGMSGMSGVNGGAWCVAM
jgi:hypothetical protein